ncbi:hypothetical protein Cgig2_023826 [Carnegiea gigantea]|uniref:Uncharacterized protein n=1 Tax=Carnegiea gigantea TaxID=171969 RepID=A0A9Q1QE51_9CARY|nr:hypothetical protein Cgig2_023826 [Carnegiea gigantea]
MTSFPTFRDTAQAAEYVKDNLRWSVRESSSLHPNPLPLHFMACCPKFDHIVVMQFAHTAHIPEMMQAIFYTMVINDAAELRLIRREIEESLMETSAQHPRLLPEDHLVLYPSFDLSVATRYAQDSNTPEMVQVIFYAMVVNEVAEQGITYRISMRCLMWALQQLHWDPFEFCASSSSLISSKALLEYSSSSSNYLLESLSSAGTPSRSSCEYSSTYSILSYEVEVSYLWEITIAHHMTDFQIQRMVKTKFTTCIRSPDELLAKVPEIVAEGPEFPGAPTRSDPQDGPSSHFPDPKVVFTLKKTALEKRYLLPTGYTFIIPEVDVTVNEPPTKCIAVYHATLDYSLRFPPHPVIEGILNKYELVPAQSCTYHPEGSKETGDLGWYCFNNRPGFMTSIEKKSKVLGFGDLGHLGSPQDYRGGGDNGISVRSRGESCGRVPKLGGLATRCQRRWEKLKAEQDARKAEKKGLPAEALSKAKAEAATGAEMQAEDEGRDLDEVEFIPPSGEGDGARDEATNPLDADAGTSDDEDREDSGELDI